PSQVVQPWCQSMSISPNCMQSLFFLISPPPPTSTLFPYTTLFRSNSLGRSSAAVSITSSQRCCGCVPGSTKLTGLSSTLNVTNRDRKSTRLNSSHLGISYAVFCLKKKKKEQRQREC